LDGELIAGLPTDPNAMQATTSAVMSVNGPIKNVSYFVFDRFDMAGLFEARFASLDSLKGLTNVHVVPHVTVKDMHDLAVFEETCVGKGFEGVMLRDPRGYYKQGRSSTKEGLLLKVKRWEDTEGVVVAVEEQEHNFNTAERDNLGRTKRSTSKAGKQPAGVLGALVIRCESFPGIEVRVGTGFDAEQRDALWGDRKGLIGKIVCFKYQPAGVLNAPRFPVFKAFRKD